jgi:hypothetical protein
MSHPGWPTSSTPEVQLITALILLLWVADIFTDHRLVATDRRDEVPSRPTMLPYKIAFPLAIHPRYMNGTLAFEVTDHGRHRLLRRNRDQDVHMISHQVPFFNPAFLLPSQLAEHLTQVRSQFPVQGLATALWDKHDGMFTLPLGVA